MKLKSSTALYDTTFWKNVSAACKARDGYTCRRCFYKPPAKQRNKLHAHHVLKWPLGKTELGNLITLCEDCHQAQHSHKIRTSKASTSAIPKLFRAKGKRSWHRR